MGFSSKLSFPSPGDLPNPGIKPTSLKSPALAGRFFTPTNSHGQRKPSGGGCRSLRQEATVCPPEAADDLQGDLFHLSSTAITADQLFFTCECRLCVCGVCVPTQVHTHTLSSLVHLSLFQFHPSHYSLINSKHLNGLSPSKAGSLASLYSEGKLHRQPPGPWPHRWKPVPASSQPLPSWKGQNLRRLMLAEALLKCSMESWKKLEQMSGI